MPTPPGPVATRPSTTHPTSCATDGLEPNRSQPSKSPGMPRSMPAPPGPVVTRPSTTHPHRAKGRPTDRAAPNCSQPPESRRRLRTMPTPPRPVATRPPTTHPTSRTTDRPAPNRGQPPESHREAANHADLGDPAATDDTDQAARAPTGHLPTGSSQPRADAAMTMSATDPNQPGPELGAPPRDPLPEGTCADGAAGDAETSPSVRSGQRTPVLGAAADAAAAPGGVEPGRSDAARSGLQIRARRRATGQAAGGAEPDRPGVVRSVDPSKVDEADEETEPRHDPATSVGRPDTEPKGTTAQPTDEQMRLARAYLMRVAEPPATALLAFVDAVGPWRGGRSGAGGGGAAASPRRDVRAAPPRPSRR